MLCHQKQKTIIKINFQTGGCALGAPVLDPPLASAMYTQLVCMVLQIYKDMNIYWTKKVKCHDFRIVKKKIGSIFFEINTLILPSVCY